MLRNVLFNDSEEDRFELMRKLGLNGLMPTR
jgi:uncharacterized protein YllA (UPF0747 family)